ncbi:MAG: hypothetical protein MPK62_10460 [Alphaproteobacteria bacterium]|nr:hypothetical protein [Alphaproteobacteria bacterium]
MKKRFEDAGYYVIRSAGSRGPFDLVAIPPDDTKANGYTLLIQGKTGRGLVSKKSRERIMDIWNPGHTVASISYKRKYGITIQDPNFDHEAPSRNFQYWSGVYLE